MESSAFTEETPISAGLKNNLQAKQRRKFCIVRSQLLLVYKYRDERKNSNDEFQMTEISGIAFNELCGVAGNRFQTARLTFRFSIIRCCS